MIGIGHFDRVCVGRCGWERKCGMGEEIRIEKKRGGRGGESEKELLIMNWVLFIGSHFRNFSGYCRNDHHP